MLTVYAEPLERKRGKITSITGCMFASKSTTLISYYQKYTFAKRKCVIIKHSADIRYDEKHITSHDQVKIKADFITSKLSLLSDIKEANKALEECYCIIIEEGHFFDDCADFAELWADRGKHVIVAGLMVGQKREPIMTMIRVIAKSEEVIKLDALCSICYEPASFTKVRDGMEVTVGGSERYTVRCRECYNKKI